MTQPLISVVTISYNQARYLAQAMDSVLDQQAADIEYVVIDGGSTDNSVDIIEQRADRLAYWQSKPDGGPAQALNAGLRQCSGKFLMYLNSDDVFLSGSFECLREQIRRFPSVDVFYGNGYTLDETAGRLFRTYSDRWRIASYVSGSVSIFQQSCLLRMSHVREVQGFNERNSTCWDGELLFDVARNGANFRRINRFLAIFRIHDQSISGNQELASQYRSDRERLAATYGDAVYRGSQGRRFEKFLRQPDIMLRKVLDRIRRRPTLNGLR